MTLFKSDSFHLTGLAESFRQKNGYSWAYKSLLLM